MLNEASEILGIDLNGFDVKENNFLDDELKSQYISYIFSCAVSDILKNQGVRPTFVSGYSMGIYAAIYYCSSVGFRDGLMLVKKAWDSISNACQGKRYGMGMIIGLSESEIRNWCAAEGTTWICNQNNPHTFIISGANEAVERILSRAKDEGALHTNHLPVSMPYHTDVLRAASVSFRDDIEKMDFNDPLFPYISGINGQVISSAADLREELIRNIYHHMNWFETMNQLARQGTGIFFECGAGDGLTRNFRFIGENFKAYSIDKLEQFLTDVKA